MDLKKVKEFIDLAKSEGVKELKYESKDLKVAVSFPYGESVVERASAVSRSIPDNSPKQEVSEKATKSSENLHEITSPFVGTFYKSPGPGESAYVSPGDKVSKGSILCILEAMKIMNEIESDVSGEIVEICVENESLVEFGQVLFKVRTK